MSGYSSLDEHQFKRMETFIHPSSIIEDGCQIGQDCYIWHFCHIMPDTLIGDRCSLGQNVVMMPGSSLGNGCRVQNNVTLYTGVHCESDVFLGPSCVFTNVINPRAFISRKNEYKETKVCKGASIGANVTIVCGVTIGEYSMIGAGAVVTKDVPPYALMTGNPARQRGWVSKSGMKLCFDNKGEAKCSLTGETYVLKDDQVHIK